MPTIRHSGAATSIATTTAAAPCSGIGTAAFTLAPNKGSTVRPAGALEGGFYNVALGVREDEGDRILTTMRWPEDDQARVYVFFYNHPETGLVTYRAVTEFIGVE